MRLATFIVDRHEHLGAVDAEGRLLVDLAAAERSLARRERRPAHACFTDMMTLLEAGARGMAAARRTATVTWKRLGPAATADGKRVHEVRRVKLAAPVPRPRKLFCLAGNYRDHIEEGGEKFQVQDAETPRVFMKPPSTTVIGSNDAILIPPVARAIDWEGELAVVIGRKVKGVGARQALGYVAGYTIMNDVSERKLLIRKRTKSRPKDEWFDWLNGKWLDTSAPQGPWLVTRDEIRDPQDLEITTRVNGERKQHNSTAQMLYPVADIIAYISAIITLEPGDIISTGTISGVGATTGHFMRPGDRVEIQISGIGTLRSRVRASRR